MSFRLSGQGVSVDLGFELEREVSPATYLWDRRSELVVNGHGEAVRSAIEVGLALENSDLGKARCRWHGVVAAARRAGRTARESGKSSRHLVGDIDRVRAAVETVLFEGRLPPDLAAWGARVAGKMCARTVEHALEAYWSEDAEGTDV